MEKRRNCSSFPHYFIYIFLTSGVKLHIHLLNVVVQFIVLLTLSILICRRTDISKCFSDPLEFEITRIDCIITLLALCVSMNYYFLAMPPFNWSQIYWPRSYKHFSCSTQLSMKFVLLINFKLLTIVNSFLLKHSWASMKVSLLTNMKMPTFVGIVFIHINKENFMHSLVKHEKSFITSGPVPPESTGPLPSVW